MEIGLFMKKQPNSAGFYFRSCIISLSISAGFPCTEAKRPLKVFLCHAHSTRSVVRALYNRLVKMAWTQAR